MPEIVIRICMIITVLLPIPSRHSGFIKFKACGTLKSQEEKVVALHLLVYLFVLFSESRAAIRRGNQERSPLEAGEKHSQEAEERERERAGEEERDKRESADEQATSAGQV